jgi:RHS repeat-associated protein
MNVIRMQTFNYDCTPHFVHFAYRFTGKERDAESGLDYFGARYYGSSMGRFMSPDWATKPEAVPYSSLSDPQTLNLYGYMRNNPLGGTDKDGHCGQQQAGGTTCPNVTVTATPATQPAPLIHHSDYRSSGAILNRLWRHLVARVRGFSSARNHAMSGALPSARKLYALVRVEDLPDEPKRRTLYVAGSPGFEWAAAMVCPCGYGETIQLNLLDQVRPCWRVFARDEGISLEPPVWRSQGCRSHFFLRDGEILWCDAPPRPQRKQKRPKDLR